VLNTEELGIFISAEHNLDNIITGQYNTSMVVLSFVVAIISAYVTFSYSERYKLSQGNIKLAWLFFGSLVMGMGVWSVHFIGMLAYQVPIVMNYNLTITIASMLPAILAASAMIKTISKKNIDKKTAIKGGILMGGGIGAMHYSGMMAMEFEGSMAYDPTLFALSIVIAITLSYFAISLKSILTNLNFKPSYMQFFCCFVMGLAIAGMHYAGMAATILFSDGSIATQGLEGLSQGKFNLSLIIALFSIITLGLALIGALVDKRITQASQEVTYNQARLTAVMENVLDGIITINSDGIILDFNPAASQIFGFSSEDVKEKNIEMLMNSDDSVKHAGYIRRYLRTGKTKVIGNKTELLAKHKDGHLFPIEISVTEMWVNGTSNFVASFRDITKRKADEEDLNKSLLQQTQQAKAAKDANEMKSGFLANMSHELRTPLNVIMGITEILKDDAKIDGLDDMVDPLDRVLNSSKHLLKLINDILDLSKIEAGKIELNLENFDLNNIVEDIKMTAEVLAQKNNNSFELTVADNIPRLHNDSMRLKQVLLNLLSNSFKFTTNGTVSLDVYIETFDNSQTRKLAFNVIDTGIGMTESQMRQLFQEFMQADSSTTKKFGGTGLGLAISKALAELMGGDIEVSSVYDEGTTFKLIIPLEPASE
jgi:PAS domain S-box-containing protein